MAQQSIDSLPLRLQDSAMSDTKRASKRYPSVSVDGHLVHVYEMGGEWEVWINCEDADFTGLCIGVGASRNDAVAQAVHALEAITEYLQGPPPA